jgi:hypothetical protein
VNTRIKVEGKKAAEVLEKQVKEKRRASTKDSRVSAGSLLSGRNLCACKGCDEKKNKGKES